MEDALILEHKNYISAKRAAQITGYTSDYVGQLCRAGKLECKMVGRSWFVLEDSILKHKFTFSEPETIQKIVEIIEESSPAIQSKNIESNIALRNSFEPISFVPPSFSIQGLMDELYFMGAGFSSIPVSSISSRPAVLKHDIKNENYFIVVLLLIMIGIGGFLFQATLNSRGANFSQTTSSITSVSRDILHFVFSGIEGTARNISRFFGGSDFSPRLADNIKKSDTDFKGMAVVPSTNSPEGDEVLKNKIRASFSDDVEIRPDQSGSAGVITPVFRTTKGNDFVYVLVPINEEGSSP